MNESSRSAGSMIIGFSAGLFAGLAVGMLMAPNSGEETRRQISEKANEITSRAQGIAKEKIDTARTAASTVARKTKSAMREGRRAARES